MFLGMRWGSGGGSEGDGSRLPPSNKDATEPQSYGSPAHSIKGEGVNLLDIVSGRTCLFTPQKRIKRIYNILGARGITPKRVRSGETLLRGLPPGPRSSEETARRWRHCVRFGQPGNRTSDLPH